MDEWVAHDGHGSLMIDPNLQAPPKSFKMTHGLRMASGTCELASYNTSFVTFAKCRNQRYMEWPQRVMLCK